MTKVCILSANFGLSSELKINVPVTYADYQIDVIKYNDDNFYKRSNALGSRLRAKIPKMLGWYYHPGYDFYIWLDSKFTITSAKFFDVIFAPTNQADLCVFKHPIRNTIESEAKFCTSDTDPYLVSRYKDEPMLDQVKYYLSDPDFVDDKLFAMGCFLYSSKIIENTKHNIMTDWLLHNTVWSIQDQLSFPYVLSKHQINYTVYSEPILRNGFLDHSF